MRIGAGIALFTLGAILKFAVHWRPSGLSVPTVGVIFMLVGVVWIIAAVLLYRNQRRSTVVTERREVPGATAGEAEYVEERRSYGEPNPREGLWGASAETTPYAEPQAPVPPPYEQDESSRPLWPGGRDAT